MANIEEPVPVTKTVKKKEVSKAPKAPPAHPPVAEMVKGAIAGLKERSGSSLRAIKKFMAGNYAVDVEKVAHFIRKFLKNALLNGELVQVKGKGLTGSFRLPKAAKKPPKEKVQKPKDEKSKKVKKTKAVPGEKKKKEKAKKVAPEEKKEKTKKKVVGEKVTEKKKNVTKKTPSTTEEKKPVKAPKRTPKETKEAKTKKPVGWKPKKTPAPKPKTPAKKKK